jgi:hypothetical protein
MPPISRRKPGLAQPNGLLGEWQDGAFRFDSPDAEKQWRVVAYRSGVHADRWDLGQVLDDKTRDVVLGGLGGPTAPVYRGPDGQYRFANQQTIEPADVRAWRRRSMRAGSTAADDSRLWRCAGPSRQCPAVYRASGNGDSRQYSRHCRHNSAGPTRP